MAPVARPLDRVAGVNLLAYTAGRKRKHVRETAGIDRLQRHISELLSATASATRTC